MKKEAMMIVIKDKATGQELGRLTPEQFRAGLEAPRSVFLAEVLEKFNETRASETAELQVRKA